VSGVDIAEPVAVADGWPATTPAPYGYVVARGGPPDPRGLIADIVLDGAGLYLAAGTPNLSIRVRLASANVPGLEIVPMGISLARGRIDGSLWELIVERARAAMPSEVLLAIVAREPAEGELLVGATGPYTLVEPQLDEFGTGDWRPQEASGCGVRATPVHDAIVEIHSHHAMRAYFSATDDRDETGRRIYGVVGRLDSPHPAIALRVATGCNPHAVGPVPFSQVFAADLGDFRDVSFSNGVTHERPSVDRNERSSQSRGLRLRWTLAGAVLTMAEDVEAIRQLVESHRTRAEELYESGLPK